MEDFTDEQTKKYIVVGKRLAFARNCAVALFLCLCVVAACFAAGDEGQLKNALVVLIVCCAVLACAVGLWAATIVCSHRLKECVCRLIDVQMKGSGILSADEKIALTAVYSGGKMTVSRANSFKEACFDLSALRKSYSVYSGFGELLVQYLIAYFAQNAGEYVGVTIADETCGVITLVADGKPCQSSKNNYFIKKGIIR